MNKVYILAALCLLGLFLLWRKSPPPMKATVVPSPAAVAPVAPSTAVAPPPQKDVIINQAQAPTRIQRPLPNDEDITRANGFPVLPFHSRSSAAPINREVKLEGKVDAAVGQRVPDGPLRVKTSGGTRALK